MDFEPIGFDIGPLAFFGLLLLLLINQVIKSTTDWTARQSLNWLKSRILTETTSRDEMAGNERAVKIEEELRSSLREHQREISEYERMLQALKSENISKKQIIEQYWKPLPAMIITFYNDYTDDLSEGKYLKKYILEQNQAEMLTATTYAIPPKGFPDRFDNPAMVGRREIEEWIQEEILNEYPTGRVVICQVSAVDLRRVHSHTDYETHSFSRKTIEQALDIESILDRNNVHRILARDRINLSEAIENGDIAFLLSRYISTEELEAIHENQDLIEEKLGNPPLRTVASDDFADTLAEAISEYVDGPEEPACNAVEEAKMWQQALQR